MYLADSVYKFQYMSNHQSNRVTVVIFFMKNGEFYVYARIQV